jgi:hypothetical protein
MNAKSTTKKTTKAKPAPKAKGQFAPDATVTWAGHDNPFREGCGAWERTELVRKASGKTVTALQSLKGLRPTTLGTLARMKLVKIGGQ